MKGEHEMNQSSGLSSKISGSGWILLSAGLHAIILGVLVIQSSLSPHPEHPLKETSEPPQSIQARLVFAAPPQAVLPPDTEIPITPQGEAPPAADSAPEPVEIKPTSEPPITSAETEMPDQQSRMDEKMAEVDNRQRLPAITGERARQMLGDFLHDRHDAKVTALGNSAAQEYRRHKNAPTLAAPSTSPQSAGLSADEQLIREATTRVNCESTAGKTATAVLSLFGGLVKCSDPPDLAPFIQQRIDRGVPVPREEEDRD